MRARLLPLLCIACLVCFPGTSQADERNAPSAMVARLFDASLPARDPLDLAVRFRGLSPETPLVVAAPAQPVPLTAGTQDNFSILNQQNAQFFQTAATLRFVTDHAYWYVESDMADRAPQADLEQSATVFETKIYPMIHRYFGSEPSPDVDGDGHIVFLLGNVPGVAAYFSSADAYPRAINPRSNQHDMIYVNLNALKPGQTAFDATITHEFQHMTQFAHCPSQEGWIDEGASELAMRVGGFDGAPPLLFAMRPDVQLNTWSSQQVDIARHYQASYLFMRYVAERGGGWDSLPTLFSTCARGEGLFSAFLTKDPIDPDVETLFSDWTVANLVQDASVGDGRYGYGSGGLNAAATGAVTPGTPFLGSVPQYAANYVNLPSGAGTATFSGDASVALLPQTVDDTGVWWSNRGDDIDSRMTRQVDLTNVTDATLQFRVWYDLEPQYDYVYLSASRDGGKTWEILPGLHTSPDGATGNNYGTGWTGSSAGAWADEQVDLTPFAGSQIRLRFEYVTDQSFNGPGFAFKDVRIPQLGLDEPGAVDGAWSAEGWVRVDAPIPERWNVRFVRWNANGLVTVDPVSVAADGTATIPLDPTAARSTLVIAPTAPRTLQPGNYSLSVSP